MPERRTVRHLYDASPTIEGAGVHLRRVFGQPEVPHFDPFLMLDDFRADDPAAFRAGFPWHPHRGIETVTYVLRGDVEHSDSMGNAGVISAGCCQWMTAGSGIIHEEMPKGDAEGRLEGFQLWVNLPSGHKMRDPRYRGIEADEVPVVLAPHGAVVRVIAGEVGGVRGPVQGIVVEPEYLDVSLPASGEFIHAVKRGHTVFAYVIGGVALFDVPGGDTVHAGDGTAVLFGDGDEVAVRTADGEARFLLISGRPLGEPVVWRGPIVMNTDEELRQAFRDYENDTFIRYRPRP
jgi:quercetin 2,3-dioxygenase